MVFYSKRAVRLCLIFVDTLLIFFTDINNQETVKRVSDKNASKTVHPTTSTVAYLSKGKPTGGPLRYTFCECDSFKIMC